MTMFFKTRKAMRDAKLTTAKKTDFGTAAPAGRRWGAVIATTANK